MFTFCHSVIMNRKHTCRKFSQCSCPLINWTTVIKNIFLSTDTNIHITKFFPCFLPPFQTGDSPTHRNVGPLKRSSERALPKLLSTWVYSWQAGIRECQLPLESYFDYLLLLIIFWLSIRVISVLFFFLLKKTH